MGSVQVPRVGRALIAALVGVAVSGGVDVGAAVADDPRPAEPVALVDLRPPAPARDPSRAQLAAALVRPGLTVVDDDRAAALTGLADATDARLASDALAEARDGFGGLACGRARPAAEDAVLLLAARAAAGLDETERLRAAWTYVMLCADGDGDPSMARAAADRLRGLGGSPAVPADAWARYPDIDAATDRDIVELTVALPAGAQPGAVVTIDHVAVGAAPVVRFVAAGKHVVAVADGPRRGAAFVTVLGKPVTLEVPIVDRAGAWDDVAARVAAWQGAAPPTARELTELMTRIGVRFAVVITASDGATLWTRAPRTALARPVVDGALTAPGPLADGVVSRVAAWTVGGPDPDRPLLTEDDVAGRDGSRSREPTRWWVYAVLGGALAAGAVTMYALDAGDNRQRLELTFP